jgi:hypothetical protein
MTFASPLRGLAGAALTFALAVAARMANADTPPPSAAPVFPGTLVTPSGAPVPAPPSASPPARPGLPPGYVSPGDVPPGYVVPPGYGAPPGYGVSPYYGAAGPQGYYPPPMAQAAARPAPFDPYFLPPPPPRRHYDVKLFAGGVTAVVGGMATVLVGAYFVSSAANRIDIYCDTPSFPCAHLTDASLLTGGAVLMAFGALVGAAGIPMWIVGSQYVTVPKEETKAAREPELGLHLEPHAGSASVSIRF